MIFHANIANMAGVAYHRSIVLLLTEFLAARVGLPNCFAQSRTFLRGYLNVIATNCLMVWSSYSAIVQ